MSNPATIIDRCRKLGLTVWPDGDRIGISPAGVLTPDLREELRSAKAEILSILREGARLMPDEKPWLYTAKQIIRGEFDGADRSTRESIAIGLRSIRHPTCQQALALFRESAGKA